MTWRTVKPGSGGQDGQEAGSQERGQEARPGTGRGGRHYRSHRLLLLMLPPKSPGHSCISRALHQKSRIRAGDLVSRSPVARYQLTGESEKWSFCLLSAIVGNGPCFLGEMHVVRPCQHREGIPIVHGILSPHVPSNPFLCCSSLLQDLYTSPGLGTLG